MKGDYDFSETGWNMNVAYLMRLDNRLDDVDKACIEFDLTRWYLALYDVYANVHWKIKKDPKLDQEIAKKFDKIHNSLESLKKKSIETKSLQSHLKLNVLKDLKDLQLQIYDFIVEQKIVDIEPKFTTWQNKIRNELELPERSDEE